MISLGGRGLFENWIYRGYVKNFFKVWAEKDIIGIHIEI